MENGVDFVVCLEFELVSVMVSPLGRISLRIFEDSVKIRTMTSTKKTRWK